MGYTTEKNRVTYRADGTGPAGSAGPAGPTDPAGSILAEVTFPATDRPGVVDIDHTFVDPSLRGQGIAGTLMRHAVDAIRSSGRRVVAAPSCSYAAAWFEKHPSERDLLA